MAGSRRPNQVLTSALLALLVLSRSLGLCLALRIAAIGDHGRDGSNVDAVAGMIKAWGVDDIISLGDCNYDKGEWSTIDANVGKHYHQWMYPYKGYYGSGANGDNHFWPVPGNHDWGTGCGDYRYGCNPGACGKSNALDAYLSYMPVNGQRYYTAVLGGGLVELFALDSDCSEPAGTDKYSTQAKWLKDKLAASTATWKLVLLHHSPYSSGDQHGSHPRLQWPYQEWGADAVSSGHDHIYERIVMGDGFPYFVNGVGGKSLYCQQAACASKVAGSQFLYSHKFGAQLIEVDSATAKFSFYSARDAANAYTGLKDCYKIQKGGGKTSYSSCNDYNKDYTQPDKPVYALG